MFKWFIYVWISMFNYYEECMNDFIAYEHDIVN